MPESGVVRTGVAGCSSSGYTPRMAKTIPQRELRNNNAGVIEAVAAGESFVITRNGVPVADLTPVRTTRRRLVPRSDLGAIFGQGPHIDRQSFREDIDGVIDPEL